MQDIEPLGPGNENWLASKVAEGSSTKEEAERLLVEFVRQANIGKVSPRITEHLRDCFAAYLAGKKRLLPSGEAGRDQAVSIPIRTLEKAFGLTRVSSGQPPIDSDTLTSVALEVLEQRLAKVSHQDALASVAENRKQAGLPVSSETEIGKAWASHKADALIWLRISRMRDVEPLASGWTAEERMRLSEIYADTPGIVLPGETPWEGRHSIPGDERRERGNVIAADGPENSQNKPA